MFCDSEPLVAGSRVSSSFHLTPDEPFSHPGSFGIFRNTKSVFSQKLAHQSHASSCPEQAGPCPLEAPASWWCPVSQSSPCALGTSGRECQKKQSSVHQIHLRSPKQSRTHVLPSTSCLLGTGKLIRSLQTATRDFLCVLGHE